VVHPQRFVVAGAGPCRQPSRGPSTGAKANPTSRGAAGKGVSCRRGSWPCQMLLRLSATGNSAGKKSSEARDRGGIFGDASRFLATETVPSRVSGRQSRGMLKTFLTAPRSRIRAGLGGGAGRTQTNHQAIMSPEVIINGRRRAFAPRLGQQDCGPIDMASPAQAPSRWHRARRSRQ
jgi:hypothetical protein